MKKRLLKMNLQYFAAKTKIEDVIVPEVFNRYVIERTAELSALYQSGIVVKDPELDALATAGGKLINMPFWQDLTGDDEVLSDSESLETDKITAGQDVAALLMRGKAWKTVAAVKSIPALGNDPEKVDVTHLGSEKKSYIKGIEDTDNLEFAIVYQGDNFRDIHALVETGKSVDWTITFPDGMTSEFTGEPYYKFDGVEVNQAVGFNLGVVVSDGPDITPAPAPSPGE